MNNLYVNPRAATAYLHLKVIHLSCGNLKRNTNACSSVDKFWEHNLDSSNCYSFYVRLWNRKKQSEGSTGSQGWNWNYESEIPIQLRTVNFGIWIVFSWERNMNTHDIASFSFQGLDKVRIPSSWLIIRRSPLASFMWILSHFWGLEVQACVSALHRFSCEMPWKAKYWRNPSDWHKE